MKKNKSYSVEKDEGILNVCEPAVAMLNTEEFMIPDDMPFANISNGILQVTPDIEEEITAVEQGEKISMSEFKTMFSQWLD